MRLVAVVLVTFGPIICYYTRVTVGIALVAMVDYRNVSGEAPSGHESNETRNPLIEPVCSAFGAEDEDGLDSIKPKVTTYGPKYTWTPTQTNLVLEAFLWTYVLCQIPNGRLAERYSGKWILGLAVIGSTLTSLISPWAASVHVYLFALARAVMGCCQSAVFPAAYVLYNKWLPREERAQALSLLGTGAYLGAILASYTTGYFLEQPEYGWPYAFYIPAMMGALWTVLWLTLGSNRPQENKFISSQELEYIDRSLEGTEVVREKARDPDWMKIICSRQIFALCVTSFTMGWASAISLFLVPSYLNYILLIHPYANGLINSVVYVIYAAGSPFTAWLSSYMIRNKTFGMSCLQVRKFFQNAASLGQAAGFLLILIAGCRADWVVLILYSQIFLFSMTSGGQVQLPSEISDEFMGSVFAIANCISSCASSISLRVFSLMVDNLESRSQWSAYFYVGAFVATFGALVFQVYGGNAREDFAKKHASELGRKSSKSADCESAKLEVHPQVREK